jgi:hypothetical protein
MSHQMPDVKVRPPIFDEGNRAFWDAMRRLLIWVLRELDKWYGWKTFEK